MQGITTKKPKFSFFSGVRQKGFLSCSVSQVRPWSPVGMLDDFSRWKRNLFRMAHKGITRDRNKLVVTWIRRRRHVVEKVSRRKSSGKWAGNWKQLLFISPFMAIIAPLWPVEWLEGNWPYCWWRLCRVSRFSIYVAFSIIKDSYRLSTALRRLWFRCLLNCNCTMRVNQGFSEIKLMMTHARSSRQSCPSVCSRSLINLLENSKLGEASYENTQKFSISSKSTFHPPQNGKNHIVYPRKANEKISKNRWRAHGTLLSLRGGLEVM